MRIGNDPKLKGLLGKRIIREFRLYRGATPSDPVCGMYSFFPAVRAVRNTSFARPVITLPRQYFNPNCYRGPKGDGRDVPERTLNELRRLWKSLVVQVHDREDLVLGTYAMMPSRGG